MEKSKIRTNSGQAVIEALAVILFCISIFLFFVYAMITSFNFTTTGTLLIRLNYCLSSYDKDEKFCRKEFEKKLSDHCLLCESVKIYAFDQKLSRRFIVTWRNTFSLLPKDKERLNTDVKKEFELKK